MVGDDLGKLVLDVLRVDRLATDTAKGGGSLVELSLLDPETGGLGEESKADGEDDGPQELDGDGDTVGSSIATALGGVDHAVGEQDTDGDAELVTSNNGTTDLLGGNLRHVQNDNGGDETDTETSNETTSSHDTEASGSGLEDTTNAEDSTTHDDGDTATDEISDITSHDGAKEGTGRQDGGNQGDLAGPDRENSIAVVLDLLVGGRKTRELDIGVFCASVLLDNIVHVQDTSNPTSIITEEDTSKGGEGDDEVGPHGDRGLDTTDIGRAGHGDNTTTRHCELGCCEAA